MYIFCKVDRHLSGEVNSRALQYDGNSNNFEYNQLPTEAKRKATNIRRALLDSFEMCYLNFWSKFNEKMELDWLNNKAGKFTY